jgi:hypothetical protein
MKAKEKPVTIGLGIVCADGVVLGVDNQYSRDPIKTKGPKLFPITPTEHYSILVAGSGNSDSVKKGVEVISDTLRREIGNNPITLDVLKAWIEASLAKLFAEHIDFAPVEQRMELHCDLLFAVWIRGDHEVKLLRTNRTMVFEEKKRACIGTGLYLAEYMMDTILPYFPSVEQAKCLAVYLIAEAKHYIEYVGGQSIIHALHRNGEHTSLLQPEVVGIEESYRFLLQGVRVCLETIDLESVSDDHIESRLEILKRGIVAFRENERKRKEDKEKRRPKLV